MVAAQIAADRISRLLATDDIERVIAIDQASGGYSRRHFFEKRFAAAKTQPDDFIHVGVVENGLLRGFAVARVHRGEFGFERAVAVLDAIGVESESRERGIGHLLMRELGEVMRRRGVHTLRSQANWTSHELLRFFAANGFKLASRLTLERPVAVPLDETTDEI